jgi:DNA-binding NtrC family response regulator
MVSLWEYDWPGNVRELENVLERFVVLCDDGTIRSRDLPGYIRAFISEKRVPTATITDAGVDLTHVLADFENRLIDEAMRRTKGNKQAAARLLGVRRTTLIAKLKRRGEPPAAVMVGGAIP